MMNNDFQKLPVNVRNEMENLSLNDLFTILKTETYDSNSEFANSIQRKVKELSLFSHFQYNEIQYLIIVNNEV